VHLANELLFLLLLLLDMTFVVLMYRLFGREGLFGSIVLAIIVCNIQVLKLVEIFGMTVTLGTVLYGSIFLTTDILAEVHGKKQAQKAVWLGFAALVVMTVVMQLTLRFQPHPFDSADPHLQALFALLPRVAFASLFAYIASQHLDVWVFISLKQRMAGRALWLRNGTSTALGQALDTTLFIVLAFAPLPILGSMPGFETWQTVWQVAFTTYLLKLGVAVLDTPFVYWARAISRRQEVLGSPAA